MTSLPNHICQFPIYHVKGFVEWRLGVIKITFKQSGSDKMNTKTSDRINPMQSMSFRANNMITTYSIATRSYTCTQHTDFLGLIERSRDPSTFSQTHKSSCTTVTDDDNRRISSAHITILTHTHWLIETTRASFLNYDQHVIYITSVRFWNSLPRNLRDPSYIAAVFGRSLKTFLFSEY